MALIDSVKSIPATYDLDASIQVKGCDRPTTITFTSANIAREEILARVGVRLETR